MCRLHPPDLNPTALHAPPPSLPHEALSCLTCHPQALDLQLPADLSNRQYQGKTGVPWTAVIPAHQTAIPRVRSSDSSTVGPPEAKLFQFDPPRAAVRALTDMVSLLVSPANAGALPAPPRLLVPWRHWASHPFSWIKSPDRLLAMHIKLRLLSAPISCIRPFTDTSIWKEVILLTGISLTLKTRCPPTTTCCPPTAPSKTCS